MRKFLLLLILSIFFISCDLSINITSNKKNENIEKEEKYEAPEKSASEYIESTKKISTYYGNIENIVLHIMEILEFRKVYSNEINWSVEGKFSDNTKVVLASFNGNEIHIPIYENGDFITSNFESIWINIKSGEIFNIHDFY